MCHGLYFEWHKLAESYTQRQLSQPTDRALAISGIATRLAALAAQPHIRRLHGIAPAVAAAGEYAAGHFLLENPHHLLWTIRGPLSNRSSTYLGPSWSWTGVIDSVTFGAGRPIPGRTWVPSGDIALLPLG
jgi:hypothetical protein